MTPFRERMQHDMLIRNLADNIKQSYLLPHPEPLAPEPPAPEYF